MKPYEIIDEAMPRGTATKLARRTGKCEDLFNSYRRAPRTPENPFGTGNYTPIDEYWAWFHLLLGVDRGAAIRMHQMVSAEFEASIAETATEGESGHQLAADILQRAVDVVNGTRREGVREMSYRELRRTYTLLNALGGAVEYARGVVRAEMNRFEPLPCMEAKA